MFHCVVNPRLLGVLDLFWFGVMTVANAPDDALICYIYSAL
jgi:hypothetical protein